MVACSTPQMLRGPLACVLEADWLRDLDWAGRPIGTWRGCFFGWSTARPLSKSRIMLISEKPGMWARLIDADSIEQVFAP